MFKDTKECSRTVILSQLVPICAEDGQAEALNQEQVEDFMGDKAHRLMLRQVRALQSLLCSTVLDAD